MVAEPGRASISVELLFILVQKAVKHDARYGQVSPATVEAINLLAVRDRDLAIHLALEAFNRDEQAALNKALTRLHAECVAGTVLDDLVAEGVAVKNEDGTYSQREEVAQ